jgi:hypothetical protein
MLPVHKQIMKAHVGQGNLPEALKITLKTYYFVEPVQTPVLYPHDRLSTLFNIIVFLTMPIRQEEIPGLKFKLPPQFIVNLGARVLLPLKAKYVQSIERCFGSDSMVAKFESRSFNRVLEGCPGVCVSLESNQRAKEIFVKDMNVLLQWAGLENLSFEKLMA